MQINVLDAKNSLSELLKLAESGEEVIIARRGAPAVRLVPVTKIDLEPLGSYQLIAAWQREHSAPILPNRSGVEIDLAISAERGAWD